MYLFLWEYGFWNMFYTEIISVSFSHLELLFLLHLNAGSSKILERKSGLLTTNIFHLEKIVLKL